MAALKVLPQAERFLSGTIITSGIDATQTTMIVDNPPTKFPSYLEIEPDTPAQREVVRALKNVGGTLSIERGVYNGGVGKVHAINSPYKQKIFAEQWRLMLDAIEQGYLREDQASTLVRTSATQFEVRPGTLAGGGDQTIFYTNGRVLRFNLTDTLSGVVASSTYDSINDKTVVTLLSGSVPNPLTAVEFAIQPRGQTNAYVPSAVIQNGSLTYSIDTGSANAYVATPIPAVSAYTEGMVISLKIANTNTGASTVNVSTLGATPIKKNATQDLAAGDLLAGQIVELEFDGTNFQLISPPSSAALAENNGWTSTDDVFIYASASSITIAGVDKTAKYPKGTRIKLTQETGGTKMLTVRAATFSTDTTITFFTITEHSLANEAITAPFYSYELNPQGYLGTYSITPTLNEVTLGNGVSTGKINVIGNRIRVQYRYVHGSTSSITGNPNYTLPVDPSPTTNSYWKGDVILEDSGAGLRYDGCDVLSGTTLYIRATNGSTGLVSSYNLSNPITFVTNDSWVATIEYDF